MPLQVDEGGGGALRRLIERLGVAVRTSTATSQGPAPARDGRVEPDGLRRRRRSCPVDVVVFATGVRPRDELARDAGLAVGERGGVVVDDGVRDRGSPTSTRSARSPASRAAPGAWSARATRWPRSSPTGCSAARRPSPAPTPPPSSSCSASTWPASATRSPSRPAASRSSTPTRWPASTRSSCSPTTPRPCSAACWSATPARTPRCGRWSAARSAPTRPPGCCPRAAAPGDRRGPARRGRRLLLQQRHRRRDPLRGRPRRAAPTSPA